MKAIPLDSDSTCKGNPCTGTEDLLHFWACVVHVSISQNNDFDLTMRNIGKQFPKIMREVEEDLENRKRRRR